MDAYSGVDHAERVTRDQWRDHRHYAAIHKALSDPTRLAICIMLSKIEYLYVKEIVRGVEQSQALVSHHLGILKKAGIVKDYRDGKSKQYVLSSRLVRDFLAVSRQDSQRNRSSNSRR